MLPKVEKAIDKNQKKKKKNQPHNKSKASSLCLK